MELDGEVVVDAKCLHEMGILAFHRRQTDLSCSDGAQSYHFLFDSLSNVSLFLRGSQRVGRGFWRR